MIMIRVSKTQQTSTKRTFRKKDGLSKKNKLEMNFKLNKHEFDKFNK